MTKKIKNFLKKEQPKAAPRSREELLKIAQQLTTQIGNENYIIELKKADLNNMYAQLQRINQEAYDRLQLDNAAAEAAKAAESKLAEQKTEGGN